MFWLFRIFCDSIQILGFFFVFLWKMSLEFWWGLHCISRWLWVIWTFLIILILPIHEHEISSHLFASSSISFIIVLEFSVYRSFTSLVKFVSKCFIAFDTIVSEIVFLISLSDISFLCIETQLIFVCCFCILQVHWIHLLVQRGVLDFLYRRSCHLQPKTVLLPHFWFRYHLFLSCLIALARTSSTMLNRSG